MGVIQRQSIKQSVVSYTAIVIGLVNIAIYTATLSRAEIGFFKFCIDTAALISPFVLLGSSSLNMRYFPIFKDKENGHNGFLFLMLLIPTIGLSLFGILFYFVSDQLITWYTDDTHEAYKQYFKYIIPITIFIVYTNPFRTFSFNFQRIVVPAILNDLLIKVSIPTGAILYFFEVINYEGFIRWITVTFLLVLIGHIVYVKFLGQLHLKPDFSKLTSTLRKEMRSFMSYTMLGSIGSILATRIDLIMISTLLGFDYGGVYGIVILVSNVIDVPRKAIANISGPIISKAWKENDLVEITTLYKKSALIQLTAGILILTGIWASIDFLFDLLPRGDDYRSGKHVILLLEFGEVNNDAVYPRHHIDQPGKS